MIGEILDALLEDLKGAAIDLECHPDGEGASIAYNTSLQKVTDYVAELESCSHVTPEVMALYEAYKAVRERKGGFYLSELDDAMRPAFFAFCKMIDPEYWADEG